MNSPDFLKWIDIGNIRKAHNCGFGGVYIIVHMGLYNRIVYVGTSSSIGRRIYSHHAGYVSGQRAIWKASVQEDVYNLMSTWHITNYIKYYKELSVKKLLWAATTVEKTNPNLMEPTKRFSKDWRSYVEDEYLPNLNVWALKMAPYDAKEAARIESKIQHSLCTVFELKGFFNAKNSSVLGNIEFPYPSKIQNFYFEDIPPVDSVSQSVLKNLHIKYTHSNQKKLAAEQLREMKNKRFNDLEARKQKISARKSSSTKSIPKGYKTWSLRDLVKLRCMLVDFDLGISKISYYLKKKPELISSMIRRLDRDTNMNWRRTQDEFVYILKRKGLR